VSIIRVTHNVHNVAAWRSG